MISGWEMWLLLVGLAVGAAIVFVALVRLPRAEDDVSDAERRTEAGWIAETIERGGGVAPPSFVEEVLELHQAYLRTPRVPLPRGAAAVPVPPVSEPPFPHGPVGSPGSWPDAYSGARPGTPPGGLPAPPPQATPPYPQATTPTPRRPSPRNSGPDS